MLPDQAEMLVFVYLQSLSQLATLSATVATELPREHEGSFPENPATFAHVLTIEFVPILALGAYTHIHT